MPPALKKNEKIPAIAASRQGKSPARKMIVHQFLVVAEDSLGFINFLVLPVR